MGGRRPWKAIPGYVSATLGQRFMRSHSYGSEAAARAAIAALLQTDAFQPTATVTPLVRFVPDWDADDTKVGDVEDHYQSGRVDRFNLIERAAANLADHQAWLADNPWADTKAQEATR